MNYQYELLPTLIHMNYMAALPIRLSLLYWFLALYNLLYFRLYLSGILPGFQSLFCMMSSRSAFTCSVAYAFPAYLSTLMEVLCEGLCSHILLSSNICLATY